MPDAGVIQEFLVGLGFKIDSGGQQRFEGAVKSGTAQTQALQKALDQTAAALAGLSKQLGSASEEGGRKYTEGARKISAGNFELSKGILELTRNAVGLTTTFAAGILATARNFEQLYYTAQRTGAAVSDLQAMGAAFRQVGAQGADAAAAISHMTEVFRTQPGREGQLLGIARPYLAGVKKDLGDVSNATLEYFSTVRAMANMAPYLADQYGQIFFGWSDAETQRHIRNIDQEQAAFKAVQQEQERAGLTRQRLDEITKQSVELQRQWNRLLTSGQIIWTQIFAEVVGPLTTVVGLLEQGAQWLEKFNATHPGAALVEGLVAALASWTALAAVMGRVGSALGLITKRAPEAGAALNAAGTAAQGGFGGGLGTVMRALPGVAIAGMAAEAAQQMPAAQLQAGTPEAQARAKRIDDAFKETAIGRFFAGVQAKLPHFQQGGIVPIAAHPGEMVLPAGLAQGLSQLVGGAGTGTGRHAQTAFERLADWLTGEGEAPKVTIDNTDDLTTSFGEAGARIGGAVGGLIGAPQAGARIGRALGGAAGAVAQAVPAVAQIAGKGAAIAGEAVKYFMGQGWSREQAAGITAGLGHESSFNPRAVGDRGAAYGLAQWHGDRQANFRQVFGHDIRQSTMGEQLAFVQWELTHSEKRAGEMIRRAATAREAGGAASRFYERPADVMGNVRVRGAAAERLAAQTAALDQTRLGGGPATVNQGDRNVTINHTINVSGAGDPHDTARRVAAANKRAHGDFVRNLKGGALA